MTGEADLAVDLERMRLGLHAVELNAVVGKVEAHTVETAKEVEMPPGTAKLAVGGRLEPDLLLLCDCPLDLAVFNRAKRLGGDLVARPLEARLFQRRRPQQAPDMISAEWWRGARQGVSSGVSSVRFPVVLDHG